MKSELQLMRKIKEVADRKLNVENQEHNLTRERIEALNFNINSLNTIHDMVINNAEQLSGEQVNINENKMTFNQISTILATISERLTLIDQESRSTADSMGKLVDASGRITGFVEIIQKIADQTNLLALNASIEAPEPVNKAADLRSSQMKSEIWQRNLPTPMLILQV